jgi:hypothetical protein
LIVEYSRKAIDGVRAALASPVHKGRTRPPWFETVASEMKLENIRNRDRPRIEFPRPAH